MHREDVSPEEIMRRSAAMMNQPAQSEAPKSEATAKSVKQIPEGYHTAALSDAWGNQ